MLIQAVKNTFSWAYHNPIKAITLAAVTAVSIAAIKNRDAIMQNVRYVNFASNKNDMARAIPDYFEAVWNGLQGKVPLKSRALQVGEAVALQVGEAAAPVAKKIGETIGNVTTGLRRRFFGG